MCVCGGNYSEGHLEKCVMSVGKAAHCSICCCPFLSQNLPVSRSRMQFAVCPERGLSKEI